MAIFYSDKIRNIEVFEIDPKEEDIFASLLLKRENLFDSERFFIRHIDEPVDVNDKKAVDDFRDYRTHIDMAGCNVREEELRRDIRYAGKKISDPQSDPQKRIIGQFDVRNKIMTYSPIWGSFFDEYDQVKFASDAYYTTLTYDELIRNQIAFSDKFYVHTRDCSSLQEYLLKGSYIFEEVSREEMLEFATNPEKGEEVRAAYLKRLNWPNKR